LIDDDPFLTGEFVETGLVTAAVTKQAEPVGLTPEGKEAMKALLVFKDITMGQLTALAREIAQDLYPLPQLLNKHAITQNQYEFLCEHNEYFKNTLASECKEWQSIASTEKRVRLQALAALEDKMPNIANRMGQAAEKLGDVVEAAKFFAKVANVDTTVPGAGGGSGGFTISIDLGADTRITIGSEGASTQASVPGGGVAVPKVVEGKIIEGAAALPPKPEGT
jgi:hypothetical protein